MVRDNQIVARTMMSADASADHRVVDGATAAEFHANAQEIAGRAGDDAGFQLNRCRCAAAFRNLLVINKIQLAIR